MPQIATSLLQEHSDSRGRILLIDDDDLIVGSLRTYLGLRGTTCDVAGERELATALMEVRKYAAVVVDPYLTGSLAEEPAALVALIRELQPETEILVLTGYGSDELTFVARSCRVAVTLPKPQPIVRLARLILEFQVPAAPTAAQQKF